MDRTTELSHDTLVTVCDQCLRACCWQGQFMCDESRTAGTVEKTVAELLPLGAEHPEYWLKDAQMKAEVTGLAARPSARNNRRTEVPKIIPPTIGRRVWYWPTAKDRFSMETAVGPDGSELQACDAGVAYVHNDRMVNLTVADHNGHMHRRVSVPLLQEGDERPSGGGFAEWMPYQVGQAKAQGTAGQ